eukprot:TRINITY_DN11113_c0_g1_i10.p1 TRINITY_DN11113_c0_g1~~TRINITY_DN11113_c0_g1_i10.p1  ORF type:complete len:144 (+),score=29.72 TRINITY_DN11113_c0_g1_i10:163-594(+)
MCIRDRVSTQSTGRVKEVAIKTMSGSKVTMDKVIEGDGKNIPRRGSIVTVHYTAFNQFRDEKNLENHIHKKFDSTKDRGKPFKFRVESGEVIKGWDQGIVQMSKGELSRMTIPPGLAYGRNGFRHLVPPDTTIVFEVELLDVA